VNWGNGNIIRNWPRATPYNVTNINNIGNRVGNTWQHNPAHRRGVRYSNANVQQRFGNANRGAGAQQRPNLGGGHAGFIAAGAGIGAAAGAALRGNQRPNVANRQAQRQKGANRPAHNRTTANRAAQRHTAANRPANRAGAGHVARGPRVGGGARASVRGGGMRMGGRGGGGFRGGGGRGGGRRSDIALKHDIVLLGHLNNGLGFYRFAITAATRPMWV